MVVLFLPGVLKLDRSCSACAVILSLFVSVTAFDKAVLEKNELFLYFPIVSALLGIWRI